MMRQLIDVVGDGSDEAFQRAKLGGDGVGNARIAGEASCDQLADEPDRRVSFGLGALDQLGIEVTAAAGRCP